MINRYLFSIIALATVSCNSFSSEKEKDFSYTSKEHIEKELQKKDSPAARKFESDLLYCRLVRKMQPDQEFHLLRRLPEELSELGLMDFVKAYRMFILRHQAQLLPAVMIYREYYSISGAKKMFMLMKFHLDHLKDEVTNLNRDVWRIFAGPMSASGGTFTTMQDFKKNNAYSLKDKTKIIIVAFKDRTFNMYVHDDHRNKLATYPLEQLEFIVSLALKSSGYVLSKDEQRVFHNLDAQAQSNLRKNYPEYIFPAPIKVPRQDHCIGIDERIDCYSKYVWNACARILGCFRLCKSASRH